MTLMTLPLFPLTTILFPEGLLPLQIFELRYLTMIKKCIADGTEFGVVAQTVRKDAPIVDETPLSPEPMSQETFVSVGTCAKIVAHSAPQSGLLRIDCVGGKRFTILRCEQQKLGLWVAQVSPIEADQAISVPQELADTVTALRQLITALTSQLSSPTGEGQRLPLTKPYLFDDCGWVANRWCELIPMQPAQRHRLLTLDNPLIRLELVQDLLETGGFLR
jgi:Lon protease-like protein